MERIKVACEISGHEAVELRSDGFTLDGSYPLVDFIINLHFASAKSTPHLTYGALWNPWDYYFMFGFKGSFANQISNDFLISCGSEKIDKRFTSTGFPLIIEPKLNHTVAQIYAEPELRSDRKLFYIGINWEKRSRISGRHHELLKELDRRGIIEIYGPKKVDGVKPWAGFKCYKGELPFDGKSVLETASKLGVALVLSSKEHKKDEIMSSRLFEGVASGAAIIGDNHSFLQKNFGSSVWQIDSNQNFKYQAEEIARTLDIINTNPKDTTRKILQSQEILKSNFDLAIQIQNIANHAKESLIIQKPKLTKNTTAIVFLDDEVKIGDNFFQSLDVAGFNNIIIITNQFMAIYPEKANVYRIDKLQTIQDYFSKYNSLNDTGEYISFFTGQEIVFPDYLELLNDIEDSYLGVFVTGTIIDSNSSSFPLSCNPLAMDWSNQLLAGVILNRSKYICCTQALGINSLHEILFYKYAFFTERKLLTISPKTRFTYMSSNNRVSNYYPEGIDNLIQEFQATPYFSSDTQWCNDLISELRSTRNHTDTPTSYYKLLQYIYNRLKLPRLLKFFLKKCILYILKY